MSAVAAPHAPAMHALAAQPARRCCCLLGVMLVPIAMTVLLSFHDFSMYEGHRARLHAEELARGR